MGNASPRPKPIIPTSNDNPRPFPLPLPRPAMLEKDRERTKPKSFSSRAQYPICPVSWRVRPRGVDLTNCKIVWSNSLGWETKGQSKVSKKPHPRGKKSKQTILLHYIKRIKQHFKSSFLLLLFQVNVSSVKLLPVIKYFLSPLASLILNSITTPGRLTVLL